MEISEGRELEVSETRKKPRQRSALTVPTQEAHPGGHQVLRLEEQGKAGQQRPGALVTVGAGWDGSLGL